VAEERREWARTLRCCGEDDDVGRRCGVLCDESCGNGVIRHLLSLLSLLYLSLSTLVNNDVVVYTYVIVWNQFHTSVHVILYWHEIGVFLLLITGSSCFSSVVDGYRLEVSMSHGSQWVSFCLYLVEVDSDTRTMDGLTTTAGVVG
jgi:hypothetical protein